jgi:hypothetical protein
MLFHTGAMERNLPRDAMEVRRKAFLELAGKIGKELDRRGISDDEIDRDFVEYKKRRRR